MLRKIDHIAVTVKSVEEAAKFWAEQLGLPAGPIENLPDRGVRVAFFKIGEVKIELVQPTEDNGIMKSLNEKGPGLHHIAIETDNVDAELNRLAGLDVRLVDKSGKPGAHDTKVGFIHPKAAGGVLVELVEQGKH